MAALTPPTRLRAGPSPLPMGEGADQLFLPITTPTARLLLPVIA